MPPTAQSQQARHRSRGNGSLRVLYATGPGDVIGTFKHWKAGRHDSSSVALTYSGQFYDACRALDARAYVVAQRHKAQVVRDERFVLEDRPNRLQSARGLLFHLGQLWYGLRLWNTAMRFKADVAIVAGGTHRFVLSLLAFSGVRVVPTVHCALWPADHRPRGPVQRMIQRLDGWFWRHLAWATICVSPECERQVREVAGGRPLRGPVLQVRAQYLPGLLDTIPRPRHARPLRVMFAGRLERNKGVFDLLEVIERLERARPGEFVVEFCGGGSAERALRDAIERRGLAHAARALGQLDAAAMRDAFARAHVVVVPTTHDFAEGLNKVTVEAVLAGRPLVASRVTNAGEVLGDALIEVPPGDLAAYQTALERLADDPDAFARACDACHAVQPIFYDRALSWETAVRTTLAPLRRDAAPPRRDAERRDWREPGKQPVRRADAPDWIDGVGLDRPRGQRPLELHGHRQQPRG